MQAYHKAQKQKAIKKGKAAVLAARQEKLAHRNPDRLQSRLDDLRSVPKPTTHERKLIIDLEREIAAVRKARAAEGVADEPKRKRPRHDETGMGTEAAAVKREENGESSDEDSDSTTESVRAIPMPPGPLPPLPGEEVVKPKTTYESKPILRDLRKEAATFVPAAVKRKLEMQREQEQREKSGSTDATGEDTEAPLLGIGINAAPDVDVDKDV